MSDWIDIAEYEENFTDTSSSAIGSGVKPIIELVVDYSLRAEDNEQIQFETGETILLEPL